MKVISAPHQALEAHQQLAEGALGQPLLASVEEVLDHQAQLGIALDQQATLEEQGVGIRAPGGQTEELPPAAANVGLAGLSACLQALILQGEGERHAEVLDGQEIGRASCRERASM